VGRDAEANGTHKMIRLNGLLRCSSKLMSSQVRLLHVGEANILPSEVDKQSAEFKVCT